MIFIYVCLNDQKSCNQSHHSSGTACDTIDCSIRECGKIIHVFAVLYEVWLSNEASCICLTLAIDVIAGYGLNNKLHCELRRRDNVALSCSFKYI